MGGLWGPQIREDESHAFFCPPPPQVPGPSCRAPAPRPLPLPAPRASWVSVVAATAGHLLLTPTDAARRQRFSALSSTPSHCIEFSHPTHIADRTLAEAAAEAAASASGNGAASASAAAKAAASADGTAKASAAARAWAATASQGECAWGAADMGWLDWRGEAARSGLLDVQRVCASSNIAINGGSCIHPPTRAGSSASAEAAAEATAKALGLGYAQAAATAAAVARAFTLPVCAKVDACKRTWTLVRGGAGPRRLGRRQLYHTCPCMLGSRSPVHPSLSAPACCPFLPAPQTLSQAICKYPLNAGSALAVAFSEAVVGGVGSGCRKGGSDINSSAPLPPERSRRPVKRATSSPTHPTHGRPTTPPAATRPARLPPLPSPLPRHWPTLWSCAAATPLPSPWRRWARGGACAAAGSIHRCLPAARIKACLDLWAPSLPKPAGHR